MPPALPGLPFSSACKSLRASRTALPLRLIEATLDPHLRMPPSPLVGVQVRVVIAGNSDERWLHAFKTREQHCINLESNYQVWAILETACPLSFPQSTTSMQFNDDRPCVFTHVILETSMEQCPSQGLGLLPHPVFRWAPFYHAHKHIDLPDARKGEFGVMRLWRTLLQSTGTQFLLNINLPLSLSSVRGSAQILMMALCQGAATGSDPHVKIFGQKGRDGVIEIVANMGREVCFECDCQRYRLLHA